MTITFNNVLALAKRCRVYMDTSIYSKDGKYRRLMRDISFKLSDGRILDIKQGMCWDENSIPYLLQWAFPKSGMYAVAALVHDALYFDTTTSQRFADQEFRKWMVALEVSPFQTKFRYWAVRLFGGRWWRKNKNKPGIRTINNRKLIIIK